MISDAQLRRVLRSDSAVRLYGDLARVVCGFLCASVAAVLVVYNGVLFWWLKERLHFNDFGRFYYSAQAYLQHQDIYGPNPATLMALAVNNREQLWNMNPPHFELLVVPLAWLRLPTAFLVWLCASALSCVLAARLIMREFGLKLTLTRLAWLLLAVVAFAPFSAEIVTGQLAWLMMWPLTEAWLAVRREYWMKSALIWGGCISIKPFLLLVVPYFMLRRQWRAAALTTGTVALIFALALAVMGIQAHRNWFNAVAGSDHWAWLTMNGSFYALYTRAFANAPLLRAIVIAPALVLPLWIATSAAAAAAAWWALSVSPRDVDRDILVVLLLSLLVSPLGWIYYGWWLIGPAVAVYCTRRRVPRLAWIGLGCLFWPLILTLVGQPHVWATLTTGSMYMWGFTLLLVSAIQDALSGSRKRLAPAVRPLSM